MFLGSKLYKIYKLTLSHDIMTPDLIDALYRLSVIGTTLLPHKKISFYVIRGTTACDLMFG